MNYNTLLPSQVSLVACIMDGYALDVGRLTTTEIRDQALNEKAELCFPCLIRRLCTKDGVPISWYLDERSTVKKAINIALIKYVDKSLYRVRTCRTAVPVTITPGPLPATLSLEGVSTAPPTIEDFENTEGEIRPPLTTACNGMLVTMPYEFISQLVDDQRQNRDVLYKVIERLPQVVQKHVQRAEDKFCTYLREENRILQGRIDGLGAHLTARIDNLGVLQAESVKAKLASLCDELEKLKE